MTIPPDFDPEAEARLRAKLQADMAKQSDAEPPQTLRDAAENLLIAIGMGWDLDGCVENLRAVLAQSDAEPVGGLAKARTIALEQRCERGTPWDLACVTIANKIGEQCGYPPIPTDTAPPRADASWFGDYKWHPAG